MLEGIIGKVLKYVLLSGSGFAIYEIAKDLVPMVWNKIKRHMEKKREYIFKQGYQKGYEEGLKEGLRQGFEEGHYKGFEEGYRKGFEEGRKEIKEEKTRTVYLLEILKKEQEHRDILVETLRELKETLKTIPQSIESKDLTNAILKHKQLVSEFKEKVFEDEIEP